MTLFEYLTVMVSVILALGLAQLLIGVGQRVASKDQIHPYWVHSIWLATLGLLHIQVWWGLWSRFNVPDLRLGFVHFAYLLSGPAVLFLSVYVLLPGSHPDDAKLHFDKVRRPLYALSLAGVLWAMAGSSLYGRAVPGGFRLVQTALIGSLLIGLVTSKRQVDAVIAPVYLGLIVAFFLVQAYAFEEP